MGWKEAMKSVVGYLCEAVEHVLANPFSEYASNENLLLATLRKSSWEQCNVALAEAGISGAALSSCKFVQQHDVFQCQKEAVIASSMEAFKQLWPTHHKSKEIAASVEAYLTAQVKESRASQANHEGQIVPVEAKKADNVPAGPGGDAWQNVVNLYNRAVTTEEASEEATSVAIKKLVVAEMQCYVYRMQGDWQRWSSASNLRFKDPMSPSRSN